MLCFFQCANTKQLRKEAPTEFEDAYFQKWNSGIKEGGSGINVFIKTKDTSVILDSVYFRGKRTKLQINANNSTLYVGQFRSKANDDSNNALKIPFKLEDDECVISYFQDESVYYYKIMNIAERESINYPSLPSNQ